MSFFHSTLDLSFSPTYPYLQLTLLPLLPTQPHLLLPTYSYLPSTSTYLLLPAPTTRLFLPTCLLLTILPYLLPTLTSYLSHSPPFVISSHTWHYLYLSPPVTFCPFVFSFISTVFTCTFDHWSPLVHMTYPLPHLHLSLPFLSTLSFHYIAPSPPQLLSNFLWFILLFSYYLRYVWYG